MRRWPAALGLSICHLWSSRFSLRSTPSKGHSIQTSEQQLTSQASIAKITKEQDEMMKKRILTSWHRVKHVKLWTMQQSLAAEWHGHHHARQSNLSYRVGTCQVVARCTMDHWITIVFWWWNDDKEHAHVLEDSNWRRQPQTVHSKASPRKKKKRRRHPKAPCVRSEKSDRTGTDRTWAPGWTCLTYVHKNHTVIRYMI